MWIAAGGSCSAAGNGDVAAIAVCAAADTGAAFAAVGGQTVGSFVIAGDGEIAAVALLYTGVVITALDGVGSIQLDGHVTAALDFHCGFVAVSGDINFHILQRDIHGRTRGSIDGNVVVCGSARIALDHGHAAAVIFCFCAFVCGM